MKQFSGLILTCALFSVWGCGSDRQDAEGLTHLSVNMESVQEKVCASAIAKSVECVPLATSNDLLLNDIVKVVHAGGNIYIADRMNLYKFDKTGSLLDKISKPGSGPGEYVNITDFVLNTDGTVWVLCRSSKQLINYDWDGAVIDSIKLNYWVGNIYKIDAARLYLYLGNEIDGDNHYQLKVLNLKTKEIEGESLAIDSKKAKYLHVKSPNHFAPSSVSGDVCFFEMFNDTIYRLADKQSSAAYYFSIGNKNIPTSFFETEYKDVMDFFQSLFKNNYAYGTNIFMESVTQYLFSFYYKGECHMSVIPKDINLSPLNFKVIEEDVNLYNYPINLTDLKLFVQESNELVLILMPSDVIAYASGSLDKAKEEELKKRLKYTDDDQNPILILMQM